MMKQLNSTTQEANITNVEMTRTDLESSTYDKLNDIECRIVNDDPKSSGLFEIGKLIFIGFFELFEIAVLTFIVFKMIL